MRIIIYIIFLSFFWCTFIVQAFQIPENKKVSFDIIRKNKVIGAHEILFSEDNDKLIIETIIDIEVKSFICYSLQVFSSKQRSLE